MRFENVYCFFFSNSFRRCVKTKQKNESFVKCSNRPYLLNVLIVLFILIIVLFVIVVLDIWRLG